MPTITFIEYGGAVHEVETSSGLSVMQAATDNNIEGIVAECGGSCSCATCHCIVDEAWFERTGGPGSDEADLLDCVSNPTPTSRLSCQITVTDELDGLQVRLPESQY